MFGRFAMTCAGATAKFAGRLCAVLLCAVSAGLAGSLPQAADETASKNKVRQYLDKAAPGFLSLSGEFRVRFESRQGLGYRAGINDSYNLVRTRVNIRVKPAPWLRFFFQGQDARAPGIRAGLPNIGVFRDAFDVRQAYVRIGSDESPVNLTAGRQLLILGDQRLVGALDWANTSREFDAVKLQIQGGGAKLTAFSASVVQNDPGRRINQSAEGNNLHGLYAAVENVVPGSTLEPYLLWQTTPSVVNELGLRGDLDRYTGGVRLWGKGIGPWDYNAALVKQWGDAAGAEIGAWGFYTELGYTLDAPGKPRFYTEYTFGSGDADPADGKVGGFVDLFPTAHLWYGYNDLVGWRNIKNLRLGVQFQPCAKLGLRFDYHSFHLADRNDGLYNVAGRLTAAAPSGGAADTRIGDEFNATFTIPLTSVLTLGGGSGYMIPGPFLKANTPGNGNTFSFLFFTYKF